MVIDAGSFLSPPTLDTRKPIDRLTADDLLVFPIWEYADDEENVEGRDETWVRPVDAKVVRKGMWSLSVAADFCTRAGLTIPGFVAVTTAQQVEIGGGVLLHPGRAARSPTGEKYVVVDVRTPTARTATARALGRTVRDVFPMVFRLRVHISREKRVRTGAFE
jgi:hypothetical protein